MELNYVLMNLLILTFVSIKVSKGNSLLHILPNIGVVEGRNQTVVEMARCMLECREVPNKNWVDTMFIRYTCSIDALQKQCKRSLWKRVGREESLMLVTLKIFITSLEIFILSKINFLSELIEK